MELKEEAELIVAAAPKNDPTTPLHRAVADLARAYMEEMRDDESTAERDGPEEADQAVDAPSTVEGLNIEEITSDAVHSAASSATPLESKTSDAASFPSHSLPKDEIISRFGSIKFTDTNDTESISELGTIIEARGVMSSLRTELLSWTEAGCCASPRSRVSRFDVLEDILSEEEVVINVDVVKTDSDSVKEVKIDQKDSVEEENEVVEQVSIVEEVLSMEVDVDEFMATVSVGSQASMSVETDLTEPTKNSELVVKGEDDASASADKAGASVASQETEADVVEEAHEPTSRDECSVESVSSVTGSVEEELAEQVTVTPAASNETAKEVSRCASPSVETEGSVTSAEVAALLAAIKKEKDEEELMRCTSPSVDTDGSVTSAEVGATLASVNKEEGDETVKESVKADDESLKEHTEKKEDLSPASDEVVVSLNTTCASSPVEAASKSSDEEVTQPIDKSTPALSIDKRSPSPVASILRLAAEAPPTESTFSPHSEASCMTNIASNQTSAQMHVNKSVHWSMSLDALSSEGDFVAACGSSKSVSSVSETTRESNTPKATGIMEGYNRKLAKDGCSGQLGDLTASFVAKIKKDWQYIESSRFLTMKDDLLSWTESGACFVDTTSPSPSTLPEVEERDADVASAQNESEGAVEKREEASVDSVVENMHVDEVVDKTREAARPSHTTPADAAAPISSNIKTRTAAETEHLHEDVYKEREYLREWKLESEETMKCQEAITCVLREQKLSLVKQCNDLEKAVKDLKEWKFDASNEMKNQSTQLKEFMSQKAALMKQCEQNQESIQELTNWKFAAEDALAIREAELKQAKTENSALSEECREQRDAIKDLTEWKIESMETAKNQLAELELAQSKCLALTTQCKTYEDSLEELTAWKSENEPVIQNQAAEMKRLNDENSTLVGKCDDQQISLYKLSRWKMNAEEEMKQQLAKIGSFEKQISELFSQSTQLKETSGQLAKWKSDAEDTIKNQIKTIDELSKWKITAAEQEHGMVAKIESLAKENADLTSQCNEYKSSIEELTAKYLNDEERATLEKLTKWKAEAKATMKEKETELNELQSHYLIFGKKCNEQKDLIQQREEEIQSLTTEINNATSKIKRMEKDSSRKQKMIESCEDTIQSQTDEVAELKAEIAKLEDRLNSKEQPYKQEMVAMKMAHHKELMVLKSERQMLASKIEKLANKNEDLTSSVTTLNEEIEELRNRYQYEKDGHYDSKAALKKLEKALKVCDL